MIHTPKKMTLYHHLLCLLHKVFGVVGLHHHQKIRTEFSPQETSDILAAWIKSGKPFMASRFGAVEIGSVANYYSIKYQKHNVWKYLTNRQCEWWWNEGSRFCMRNNAGFFPTDDANLELFGELMLEDMKNIDVLFSWQEKEVIFREQLQKAKKVGFIWIDPFWCERPWTSTLAGKTVLVVHPFANEIYSQYKNKRKMLHANPDILPEFNLITIKAVQSIGGNDDYEDWFDALEAMKAQISAVDFDVCLLGCGAYGMPLAAFIKRLGKQAIHFGGSLQLLFGIKGKRWESEDYGRNYFSDKKGKYPSLINEHWIRPYDSSKFNGAEKVENGCYW